MPENESTILSRTQTSTRRTLRLLHPIFYNRSPQSKHCLSTPLETHWARVSSIQPAGGGRGRSACALWSWQYDGEGETWEEWRKQVWEEVSEMIWKPVYVWSFFPSTCDDCGKRQDKSEGILLTYPKLSPLQNIMFCHSYHSWEDELAPMLTVEGQRSRAVDGTSGLGHF